MAIGVLIRLDQLSLSVPLLPVLITLAQFLSVFTVQIKQRILNSVGISLALIYLHLPNRFKAVSKLAIQLVGKPKFQN